MLENTWNFTEVKQYSYTAIPLALVRWGNTTVNSLRSPSCMSYLQTYGKVRNACYIFKTVAKCPKEQK